MATDVLPFAIKGMESTLMAVSELKKPINVLEKNNKSLKCCFCN